MRRLKVRAETKVVEKPMDGDMGADFAPVDVPSGGDAKMMETPVADADMADIEADLEAADLEVEADVEVTSTETFDKVLEAAFFEGLDIEKLAAESGD